MAHALSKSNAEHALALGELKSGFNEQLGALTKAIALMVKVSTKNNENKTPRKRRRKNRYGEDSSSDEYSSEEEETPPQKQKAVKKKGPSRHREKKSTDKGFGKTDTYRKGMKFDPSWPYESRQNFIKARRIYHAMDTTAARADRIAMLKDTLIQTKKDKTRSQQEELSAVIKMWEEKASTEYDGPGF